MYHLGRRARYETAHVIQIIKELVRLVIKILENEM